jgi:hypothetical protein
MRAAFLLTLFGATQAGGQTRTSPGMFRLVSAVLQESTRVPAISFGAEKGPAAFGIVASITRMHYLADRGLEPHCAGAAARAQACDGRDTERLGRNCP